MLYVMLIAAAVLIALQVYDFWSTPRILKKSGGRELNPLMAKLMEAVGIMPALIITKGGAIVAVAGAAWLTWTKAPETAWIAAVGFGAAAVFYCVMFWKTNFKHDGI